MKRASNNRVSYTPCPDATPESELNALAAVYAFVLEARTKKRVAVPSGPENGVKEDEHVHTKGSILR